METALTVFLGLGLAAAAGFRVFVPLLVMSLAVRSGHLAVTSGFDWVATDAALVVFAIATVLEVGAYLVPWLDNLLDSIATPAAVVAGVLVTASVITDMSPLLRWSLAVVAGGGVATTVQGLTVGGRQLSSLSTLGLGNPLVALVEGVSAVVMAVLSVLVPVAAAVLLVLFFTLALRKVVFRPPRQATG